MKIFVVSPDFTAESPAWINIFWPHYNAIASAVTTVHLSSPEPPENQPGLAALNRWKRKRTHGRRLVDRVLAELDPDGPNILLVWALRGSDIERAMMLDPVWERFDHHVLAVVDNLQPKHAASHVQGRYERITCFCGDLTRDFEETTEIRTLFFPPHTDALTFHNATPYRPIDLFLVGRRDAKVYFPIHRHFNAMGQDRLSLDFVSRTRNTRYTSEEEFRLLAATYGKSKAAFCFDPSKLDRFHARSPLTERWVHAWTSGCTVIGTAPTGRGVAEASGWPEAMIDLPDDAQAAIEATHAILSDEAGLERRRIRNVAEALRRHDTRHRLGQLLDDLNLPRPAALTAGIEALKNRADAIEADR